MSDEWLLAAHLRHEHGWSWKRLLAAFGSNRATTQRDIRHRIEYAAERMRYTEWTKTNEYWCGLVVDGTVICNHGSWDDCARQHDTMTPLYKRSGGNDDE